MAQCDESTWPTKADLRERGPFSEFDEVLLEDKEARTKVQICWEHIFQEVDELGVAIDIFGEPFQMQGAWSDWSEWISEQENPKEREGCSHCKTDLGISGLGSVADWNFRIQLFVSQSAIWIPHHKAYLNAHPNPQWNQTDPRTSSIRWTIFPNLSHLLAESLQLHSTPIKPLGSQPRLSHQFNLLIVQKLK